MRLVIQKVHSAILTSDDFKSINSVLIDAYDMIEHLYRVFGITQKTEISTLEKFDNTDYPRFSDLIAFLPDYKKLITGTPKDIKEILTEIIGRNIGMGLSKNN